MRCPYCGAEVVGRKCIYCTSDLIEHIKKNGLEVDDFAEESPAVKDEKQAEAEKKRDKKRKKKRVKRSQNNTVDEIRILCADFLKETKDGFGSYDGRRKLTGGKEVNRRLFDILNIPEGEEVFLIHDDTLLGNGKNGFAITDHGFYCKEFLDNLIITRFDDITDEDVADKMNSTIYLTNEKRKIVYLSGSSAVLEKLEGLCEDILDAMFDE